MEIDDELFRFMTDVRGDLGEIKSAQKGMDDHLHAVSNKVDSKDKAMTQKVDNHIADLGAHGIAAQRHGISSIATWVALGLSIVGLGKWIKE